MDKKALIIGHTGQDGSYLKELLQSFNYKILGVSQSEVFCNFEMNVQSGDICDSSFTDYLIMEFQPDELYYLAAIHQSSIEETYNDLDFYKKSLNVNANGLLNFLNSIHFQKSNCKVFYAASSHVFGNTTFELQDEETPFCPVSIYGITKVLGIHFCELYRQKGLICSVGIFYNHESPRRDSKFVSKKIVETAVAIRQGKKDRLELGDLSANIDWGYAPDYVNAAYLMLQNSLSGNYIVSSGKLHTVVDFVQEVFKCLDLDWTAHVVENKSIILKKSVTVLRGDSSKLRKEANWDNSVSFEEMIQILVRNQLSRTA